MKTYITSDLHFEHANIKKFCPVTRAKYNDVNHMREEMIREWNEIVTPEDRVYILGDVAFCNAEMAVSILGQLNGKLVLIEGNHDRKLLKSDAFRSRFESIHKYFDMHYNGIKVVMFHYPIAEWDQMHRGSVHFHGHLHGNKSGLEEYRARDMGMDATGKIVLDIEEAIMSALTGKIKSHHDKY